MSSFIIVKLEIFRKMKKIYVLFMSSLLLLSCAKDDVSKPSEWPEWPTPSKPKIENAVLRGVNGETVVAAGDKVKFTAQISDEYNDLVSFQLLVTMDGAEILNLSKGLSGRSAVIEEEATLPFVAGFQNGRPVVTIKAVNDLGGNESTLTLDEAASVALAIALVGQTAMNGLMGMISQYANGIGLYPYLMIASLAVMLLLYKRSLK